MRPPRALLRACLCAVVLQQAVWASALRLQLGTAAAVRCGGRSGPSDVVCWPLSMCASASEEEPAAEVQSDAYRPLMFTDREAEKVGDKGAATLAPEGGVDEPALNLRGMDQILKQLESIQKGTPKNIVILGTRHCSLLHQQIIELLSYALVLSDNHIYTSGATGTHAAAIRGALRAENQDLLTVILPQTILKQPREIRDLLGQVNQVIELGHNQLPLDAASRICNSELLSKGDQLIVFAFHDSKTLIETIEEAKAMSLLTTVLFLD